MIKELIEKRQRLHEENAGMLATIAKEGRDVFTSEEEQEWQSRDQAIEAITRNIMMRQKQDQIEQRIAEVEERKTQPSQPGLDSGAKAALRRVQRTREDFDLALRGWFLTGTDKPVLQEHRDAAERMGFNLQAKAFEMRLSKRPPRDLRDIREWELEQRAQTVTTTGGGYTIPDEMMLALEKALLWFGGMRQVATILRTDTGADLPIPTANDTTNAGEILGINTQVNNQDVVFGQLVLHAFKYSSKQVLVPVELMQDSSVNLPAMLGEMLGERIGRIQNTHFTNGAGTTLPFGITTRAVAGPTGATGGGITYANIVDLEHSVDVAYRRQGAAFMMSDNKVAVLKKITDTAGRPIWQPNAESGMAQGAPATLLGYPVYINNDMSTAVTTGTKAVLFGALQKYLIRDTLGITLLRLDERYADFHQIAFLAFARADGDLLNAGTNPVKYLGLTT